MNKLAPPLLALMTTLAATTAAELNVHPIARLDALFGKFSQPDAPGASAMVIHHGQPVFARGYGLADLETGVPCSTNTNFRLASVTKQFTAMAIMILAERKKLSLDERLTDLFPEFPAYGSGITVRQLLTHTSGLPDYEGLIPTGTTLPVLDRDVLRILLKQDKTSFPPGSRFRYSNSGYALLALIVEARSGQTFARFLDERIFAPLGMTQTLAYEQGVSAVPHRAFGHSLKSNAWQRTDQSLTSSVLGDGGVYSCVADLAKWDAALYTTNLVSREMLDLAFTSATPTDQPGRGYGFGWFIGEYRGLKEIWHGGETIGFRTRIARFPEKEFTVIILANRSDVRLDDFPHQVADLFLFSTPPGSGG